MSHILNETRAGCRHGAVIDVCQITLICHSEFHLTLYQSTPASDGEKATNKRRFIPRHHRVNVTQIKTAQSQYERRYNLTGLINLNDCGLVHLILDRVNLHGLQNAVDLFQIQILLLLVLVDGQNQAATAWLKLAVMSFWETGHRPATIRKI